MSFQKQPGPVSYGLARLQSGQAVGMRSPVNTVEEALSMASPHPGNDPLVIVRYNPDNTNTILYQWDEQTQQWDKMNA